MGLTSKLEHDAACNHAQIVHRYKCWSSRSLQSHPTSGSSTYVLRQSNRNTELRYNSISNYLHCQVVITKTDQLSIPQRSLPKGNYKHTTKKGTTILMVWPVSSYFLASALTRCLKKHLERLISFQPQKSTTRMFSLVRP